MTKDNDYTLFSTLCENTTFFVTRLKENALYTSLSESDIPEKAGLGDIKDEVIHLQVKEKKVVIKTLPIRR